MWETCAVDLRVRLPKPVAAEIEEVQRRDPEMLSRILFYAVTRQAFFNHLAELSLPAETDESQASPYRKA